ncbi:hypothetical protein XENOCAPTIV_010569 [Xenoophorus captivus]|uniref:Uncharacterized protein n=1 Tax=Xenoophorus captivus TaxID=1517983 RepID=A0ABV0R803_9TELE
MCGVRTDSKQTSADLSTQSSCWAHTERGAAAVQVLQGTQIIKINLYTHISHGAVLLRLPMPCGSTKCFRKKEVWPDAAAASVSSSRIFPAKQEARQERVLVNFILKSTYQHTLT